MSNAIITAEITADLGWTVIDSPSPLTSDDAAQLRIATTEAARGEAWYIAKYAHLSSVMHAEHAATFGDDEADFSVTMVPSVTAAGATVTVRVVATFGAGWDLNAYNATFLVSGGSPLA